MSTGQPKQPPHSPRPSKSAAQSSILPQNIHLTDAEEAALDEIWAQIAAEDPDAAESMRHDGKGDAGEGARKPDHS